MATKSQRARSEAERAPKKTAQAKATGRTKKATPKNAPNTLTGERTTKMENAASRRKPQTPQARHDRAAAESRRGVR